MKEDLTIWGLCWGIMRGLGFNGDAGLEFTTLADPCGSIRAAAVHPFQ